MMCSEKFRPDEDDQLIELVHANPCLWNMTDPDFKKEKRFIWAEIGRKLTRRQRSGLECKSRWRSIRDYYKKQKKDENNGTIQIPAIKRRQVYWNSLKFLDDADDEIKALSNVHVEISEDVAGISPIDFRDFHNINEAPVTFVTKKRKLNEEEGDRSFDLPENYNEFDDIIQEGECIKQEETADNMSSSIKVECQVKDKFKQPRESRATQEFENRSTASEQDGADDEIDLFFKAMAATVKKFSPKLKVESKSKIFSVVHEHEIRHLEPSNQCPNCMDEVRE